MNKSQRLIGYTEYSTYILDSEGDDNTCLAAYIVRIWNKSTSEAEIEFDDGDVISLDDGEKMYNIPISCSTVDVNTLSDESIEITVVR